MKKKQNRLPRSEWAWFEQASYAPKKRCLSIRLSLNLKFSATGWSYVFPFQPVFILVFNDLQSYVFPFPFQRVFLIFEVFNLLANWKRKVAGKENFQWKRTAENLKKEKSFAQSRNRTQIYYLQDSRTNRCTNQATITDFLFIRALFVFSLLSAVFFLIRDNWKPKNILFHFFFQLIFFLLFMFSFS